MKPRGPLEWLSPGLAAGLLVAVIFIACAWWDEPDFFGQVQAAFARLVSVQQQIGGRT